MCSMQRLSRPVIAMALILSAGPGWAAPEVANGATPRDGVETLPLEELWRIGGPDDEENLLGVVNDVLADDDGNVYLLDIQLVEVQVFDTDGQYVRTLGQRGDGPGELRFVTDALFMPDGSVGLVQPFPGRIVKVDLMGVPTGEVRPGGDDPTKGGFFAVRSAASRGNELVISGTKVSRRKSSATMTNFVGRLGPDGAEGLQFVVATSEREPGNQRVVELEEYFPHADRWALGPDGRVAVVSQRNAFLVDVYGPDGVLQMTVTRAYEPLRRTDEETERAKASLMPWRRRKRDQIEFVLEPTEPAIQRVRWDQDGSLWVLPGRGTRDQAPGIHSTWDVFAPDGTFGRQVSFACSADGQRDAIFFPGGDLVVIVKEHREALLAFQGRGRNGSGEEPEETEVSPLQVVCYRIAPTLARPTE